MTTFNIKDFGAIGDGITNDTQAFQDAGVAISENNGGTLIIPEGKYLVGRQTFANGINKGYAYKSEDILAIVGCTNEVIIKGIGKVEIKAIDSLKFGSFDPLTGEAFIHETLPFTNPNYAAGAYRIFMFHSNNSIKVFNIELNGNNETTIIGGQWGDKGIQLNGYGIYSLNNKQLHVENCHLHHMTLDGILSGYVGVTETSDPTPVTLINVRSEYNSRQGLSWVGGIGLTAVNCQFNHTGRVFHSSPAAGIDIEAEYGVNRNGLFINCEIINNVGVGIGADMGDSADIQFINCKIIGTTYYPIWPRKPRIKFTNCIISGQVVNAYAKQNPLDEDYCKFINCTFTDSLKYQGKVYMKPSWFLLDLGGGSEGVYFERCSVKSNIGRLVYTRGLITMKNCKLEQNSIYGNIASINFVGNNTVKTKGYFQFNTAYITDKVIVNGNIINKTEL